MRRTALLLAIAALIFLLNGPPPANARFDGASAPCVLTLSTREHTTCSRALTPGDHRLVFSAAFARSGVLRVTVLDSQGRVLSSLACTAQSGSQTCEVTTGSGDGSVSTHFVRSAAVAGEVFIDEAFVMAELPLGGQLHAVAGPGSGVATVTSA